MVRPAEQQQSKRKVTDDARGDSTCGFANKRRFVKPQERKWAPPKTKMDDRWSYDNVQRLFGHGGEKGNVFAKFLAITTEDEFGFNVRGVLPDFGYEFIGSFANAFKVPQSALYIACLDSILTCLPANTSVQLPSGENACLSQLSVLICRRDSHQERIKNITIDFPHQHLQNIGANTNYEPKLFFKHLFGVLDLLKESDKVVGSHVGLNILINKEESGGANRNSGKKFGICENMATYNHYSLSSRIGLTQNKGKDIVLQILANPRSFLKAMANRGSEDGFEMRANIMVFSEVKEEDQAHAYTFPSTFCWQSILNSIIQNIERMHRRRTKYVLTNSAWELLNKHLLELEKLSDASIQRIKQQLRSNKGTGGWHDLLESFSLRENRRDHIIRKALSHKLLLHCIAEIENKGSVSDFNYPDEKIKRSDILAAIHIDQVASDQLTFIMSCMRTLQSRGFIDWAAANFFASQRTEFPSLLRTIVQAKGMFLNICYLANNLDVFHYTQTATRVALQSLYRPLQHPGHWGSLIQVRGELAGQKTLAGIARAPPHMISPELLERFNMTLHDYTENFYWNCEDVNRDFFPPGSKEVTEEDYTECMRELGRNARPKVLSDAREEIVWNQLEKADYKFFTQTFTITVGQERNGCVQTDPVPLIEQQLNKLDCQKKLMVSIQSVAMEIKEDYKHHVLALSQDSQATNEDDDVDTGERDPVDNQRLTLQEIDRSYTTACSQIQQDLADLEDTRTKLTQRKKYNMEIDESYLARRRCVVESEKRAQQDMNGNNPLIRDQNSSTPTTTSSSLSTSSDSPLTLTRERTCPPINIFVEPRIAP